MKSSENSRYEEQKLNENPTKNIFDNIKSNYIFKIIFNFLHKKKLLEINQYNKKLQNRLNLSLNDYKEDVKLYSSIELEIKLIKNKSGKFINISKEEEPYYHIYFNDNKEEIKKYDIDIKDNITKIKIKINYQITSFERLFNNCKCIESIYFKKFFRNNITNMSWMFVCCSSLKEIKFSNFNTENVTNMSRMFFGCSALKEIDLSNFITNNVTDMCFMFSGCSSLKKINVSNFIAINVRDINGMFFDCISLEIINLFKFFPKNFKNVSHMFANCSSLKNINFSNSNNKEYLRYKYNNFEGCPKNLKNKIGMN